MLKSRDMVIRLWVYMSSITIIFVILSIAYFIVSRGISGIDMEFLLQNPRGVPPGSEGGIRNAITGSFFLLIIAVLFSMFTGVSCAVYNTLYCRSHIVRAYINVMVQCMASVPSVITGLFVYGFFIVGLGMPRSMLTAGISLGIMVFPFVERRTERAILTMERNFIRDSKALGIGYDYMCRKLVLPAIRNEIVSIGLLAGSYAIGATAPILLTGAVFTGGNSARLLKPVTAMPFHLHMLLGQTALYEKAYATAFVLVSVLAVLHILSGIVISKPGGKIIEYLRNKKCKYIIWKQKNFK